MSIVTNLKCTLAVTAGLCSSFAYAQKHPHVILIMTDQQRGDALGCMGNEVVISPNLDRLAGEGTLFMNGYSSCPSSTPARAGMLTGLSPWHHGLLGYGEVSPEYKYEMPQMMKDAGYYTFGIGKMHWHPQRIKHGFEGTLLDESGRIEDPNFTSDYRLWFQIQAPGRIPMRPVSAGTTTVLPTISCRKTFIPPIGRERWLANLSKTTTIVRNHYS